MLSHAVLTMHTPCCAVLCMCVCLLTGRTGGAAQCCGADALSMSCVTQCPIFVGAGSINHSAWCGIQWYGVACVCRERVCEIRMVPCNSWLLQQGPEAVEGLDWQKCVYTGRPEEKRKKNQQQVGMVGLRLVGTVGVLFLCML